MPSNCNIYVFITPFHLRQISAIKADLPQAEQEIVFYSEFVDVALIRDAYPGARLMAIPEGKVAFQRFLRNPFGERKKLRSLFGAYDRVIGEVVSMQNSYNLIFGTEKDTFVQSLINFLLSHKLNNKIIAVDEGMAYYTNNTAKAQLLKAAYKVLSPWIFGRKIRYVYTLGSIPEIDQIYVRFLEAARKVRRQPERCRQILHRKRIQDHEAVRTSKKVLLLTPPLSEDHLLSVAEEQAIVNKLLELLPASNIIHIKQHPREHQQKYAHLRTRPDIQLMDPGVTAEEIKFSDYGLIIHFMSSVVMELHLINYPKERIITLDPFDIKIALSFLYKDTIFVRLKDKGWPDSLAGRLSLLNFEPGDLQR